MVPRSMQRSHWCSTMGNWNFALKRTARKPASISVPRIASARMARSFLESEGFPDNRIKEVEDAFAESSDDDEKVIDQARRLRLAQLKHRKSDGHGSDSEDEDDDDLAKWIESAAVAHCVLGNGRFSQSDECS